MSTNYNAISDNTRPSVRFHILVVLVLGCFVLPALAHQPSPSPNSTSFPAAHQWKATDSDPHIRELGVTEVVDVSTKSRKILTSILMEIMAPPPVVPIRDAFSAHADLASHDDTSFAVLNQHVRPPQLVVQRLSNSCWRDGHLYPSTYLSETPLGIDQHTGLSGFINGVMDQQRSGDKDYLFLRSNKRSVGGQSAMSLGSALSKLWEGFWK